LLTLLFFFGGCVYHAKGGISHDFRAQKNHIVIKEELNQIPKIYTEREREREREREVLSFQKKIEGELYQT
jgi:hypothetical protein